MQAGLGYRPRLNVPLNLSTNQDFIHEEVHPTGHWPAGTSARIVFADGAVWPATVVANTVRWRVESTAVAAANIRAGTRYRVYLTIPTTDGSGAVDDWFWFTGNVFRTD